MSDDDDIHLHVTYVSYLDMDEAFCARMLAAIAAGLGKRAGSCNHHSRNQKSKIRSNKATGTLLAGIDL